MATQRIDLTVSSPVVQQLFNIEQLKAEDASKIVSISQSSSKRMVTNTAPRLVPPDSKSVNFQKAYAAFMILISEWEQFLMTALNKLNQSQTGAGKSLLELAEADVQKAQKQEQEIIKQKEAAAHQSLWSKIGGYIVAGLALIVTALTGGATAFLLAAAVTAIMLSPASQDLDKALQNAGLSPAEAGLVQLIIVIVATVILSGGAGMLSAGEDAGTGAAEDGAGDAAPKKSLLEKAASGLTKSNALTYGTQMFTVFNPTQNLMEGLLEASGTGKDKAKLIAMILGIITSVIALAVGMKAGAEGADKDCAAVGKFKKALGPQNLNRLLNVLRLLRAGANITSGAFNIEVYETKNAIAALQKAMGATNKNIFIEQGTAQIENDLQTQTEDQYSNAMRVVEQMISNENKILQPYDEMARRA